MLNGTVAFVRCYLFKKGILNDIDGLAMAGIQGFFSFMKYTKLIALQRPKSNGSTIIISYLSHLKQICLSLKGTPFSQEELLAYFTKIYR